MRLKSYRVYDYNSLVAIKDIKKDESL
jgi:hypothetical protein